MRSSCGVFLGTALLALVCQTTAAHAQSCQKDNDCPGDLICNGGQCQTLSGATPPAAATAAAGLGTMAAAPAARPVTVQFEGEPAVLLDQVTGQTCQAPCSMQLVPGNHAITMDGMQDENILVPNQGGSMHVTKRDSGLLFGGVMLTTFGSLGTVFGLVFTALGDKTEEDDPSTHYTDESELGTDFGAIGYPLLLGGGAMLAGGIVMLTSADSASITPSTAPLGANRMPMFGVAPVHGGVVAGATVLF